MLCVSCINVFANNVAWGAFVPIPHTADDGSNLAAATAETVVRHSSTKGIAAFSVDARVLSLSEIDTLQAHAHVWRSEHGNTIEYDVPSASWVVYNFDHIAFYTSPADGSVVPPEGCYTSVHTADRPLSTKCTVVWAKRRKPDTQAKVKNTHDVCVCVCVCVGHSRLSRICLMVLCATSSMDDMHTIFLCHDSR